MMITPSSEGHQHGFINFYKSCAIFKILLVFNIEARDNIMTVHHKQINFSFFYKN